MRYLFLATIFLLLGTGLFLSCAKYKDPAATTDPRLTNPYCNDPNGVNYNWGFPGRPDNTVCFYPTDLFEGRYLFRDSIYATSSGLFLAADSFYLDFRKISSTKVDVGGFCNGAVRLMLTAGATYIAAVDTLVGDSTTLHRGQQLCRAQDTIAGTFIKDRIDSALLHITLDVATDTGSVTHVGNAIKQ